MSEHTPDAICVDLGLPGKNGYDLIETIVADIVQCIDLAAAPTEDEGGDNADFPCAPGSCLKTLDFAPIEPESTEYKYYLPGTGFVLAVDMEDGELTGEREELICIGDSLEVLENPDCGIDDVEELLDELCVLAPETFCGADEEDE